MDQIDPQVVELFQGLSLQQVYEKGLEIQRKALEREFRYRQVSIFLYVYTRYLCNGTGALKVFIF